MNTCIYLRKSRKGDDPDETAAETLRRHREQLLALAQERGLNVVEIKEAVSRPVRRCGLFCLK